MTTALDVVVRARDQASQVFENVGEAGSEAGSFIEDNWKQATAVLAGAGAAIEGMARKQAPLTEGVKRLSARTGENEDAVRTWGEEISNVTFPMEDAIGLMETATQRGLEGKDALQEYASFWDTVGDATDENAEQLADADAGLRAVGIAAGEEKEALGAFGFVTDETSGNVGEFLQFLDRAGPELREMGGDVDDAAAILGVMENEMGMSARTARREFQQAVREADGDMGKMLETLGVSAETFDEYKGKVGESSGVIQRNADIHAESYTPIQRLQHAAGELAFRFGGVAEAASMMAPVLIAAGPAAKGLTMAKKGLATATTGVGKAMSWLAANPIVLVIAAIVALVAAIVWLWNNNEDFRDFVIRTWEAITSGLTAAMEAIRDFFIAAWDTIKRTVTAVWNGLKAAARTVFDGIRAYFRAVLGAYKAVFLAVWNAIKTAVTGVWNGLRVAAEAVWGAIRAVVSGAVNAVSSAIAGALDTIRGAWSGAWNALASIVSGVWDTITGRIRRGVNKISGFINRLIRGWNSISFSVSIPSVRIPGTDRTIGGGGISVSTPNIPQIPTLHGGGIFRAPTAGGQGLAMLRDRELVSTPEQAAAGQRGLERRLDRVIELLSQLLASLTDRDAVTSVDRVRLQEALADLLLRREAAT